MFKQHEPFKACRNWPYETRCTMTDKEEWQGKGLNVKLCGKIYWFPATSKNHWEHMKRFYKLDGPKKFD